MNETQMIRKKKNKIVYMPMETLSRELDARLVLGHSLVTKNTKIVIADQQYIRFNAGKINNGVYFGKHLFGKPRFQDQKLYNTLKGNGNSVVYLSEEGGIWPGNEENRRMILERLERPALFSEDDVYCTWGEWQLNHIKSLYNLKCSALVTGAPRFAILDQKYDFMHTSENDSLMNSFGDYILINTAFTAFNGPDREKGWFKNLSKWGGSLEEKLNFGSQNYVRQGNAVISLVELISKLSSEFPKLNIIIRPHPGENQELYENIFQWHENVHVVYTGTANEWIRKSKVLIQTDCTTGIEAVMMGKPVINWSPTHIRNQQSVHITQSCGHTAETIEEVLEILRVENFPLSLYQKPIDDPMLKNFSDNDTITKLTKVIFDVLEAKSISSSWLPNYFSSVQHKIYLLLKECYFFITGQGDKLGDHKQRFSKIDKQSALRKVSDLNRLSGKNIKISYYDLHAVVLSED